MGLVSKLEECDGLVRYPPLHKRGERAAQQVTNSCESSGTKVIAKLAIVLTALQDETGELICDNERYASLDRGG